MVKIRLKYLSEDMDRHGNVRAYVRIKGRPKVRIEAPFGTEEFMREYHAAVAGKATTAAKNRKTKLTAETYRWGAAEYFGSVEFKQLGASTRRVRRNIIERAAETCGDVPLKDFTRAVIFANRNRRSDHPEAANGFLKAMNAMFKYLLMVGHVTENPAVGVPRMKSGNPDGWHTWTVEEAEQFIAKHPLGTQAHLAWALMSYTGCRRSDAVLLGRQHVRDGWLKFTVQKNKRTKPVQVEIPIIAELKKVLDASKTGDLAFLVSERGTPFVVESFGNKFKRWCKQAGLPQCSPHGLRKAAATMLANNGATEFQLNAIFGWSDPKMAARYTKAANRKHLAGGAMGKIVAAQDENESVPLSGVVEVGGTDSGKNLRKTNGRKQ